VAAFRVPSAVSSAAQGGAQSDGGSGGILGQQNAIGIGMNDAGSVILTGCIDELGLWDLDVSVSSRQNSLNTN
jgi:hypothetical protein